jgi:hypothetical protein
MRRSLVLTVLLSLGLAACGQTDNQGGVRPTTPGSGTSAATSVTPSGTAQPSATPRPPQFPAPAELQGTWQAIDDDNLTLRIRETGYTITRVVGDSPAGVPLSGIGSVEVDGDEIVFSSSLCAGDGPYRGAIEGDVLRFTSIAPDPCPRPLDGIDYARDG